MAHIDINHLSTTELDQLIGRARARANALRANEPSISLALQAGIRDKSYTTPRHGRVEHYEGTAIITMANGDRWEATGYGPRGDAYTVTSDGGISFRKLEKEEAA